MKVTRKPCHSEGCPTWPTWKIRAAGDRLERNWVYACGRHLNSAALECASDVGVRLDVVRVRSDER